MTDEQHFDAALATVYDHHGETRHGLKFLLCLCRLEFACPRCGLVLYEGPEFQEDGRPGWQLWNAPKKRPKFRTEKNH